MCHCCLEIRQFFIGLARATSRALRTCVLISLKFSCTLYKATRMPLVFNWILPLSHPLKVKVRQKSFEKIAHVCGRGYFLLPLVEMPGEGTPERQGFWRCPTKRKCWCHPPQFKISRMEQERLENHYSYIQPKFDFVFDLCVCMFWTFWWPKKRLKFFLGSYSPSSSFFPLLHLPLFRTKRGELQKEQKSLKPCGRPILSLNAQAQFSNGWI